MKQLGGTGLKRLHREWRRRTPGRLALVLEDVQSPFNVGAIVRTAAAYQVDHVWVAGSTPPLDEPKVGKTALGCERYLTWRVIDTGPHAVAAARADGYLVVGLELAQGAVPLHELLTPPWIATTTTDRTTAGNLTGGDATPADGRGASAAARDVCLIVGAEDRGVRPVTLDAADVTAYLPLLGRVGSLNVASATAIACYEVRRSHWV
jgi:tRNA (guanosine-2'-O-)-methyltransferase